MRRIIFSAGCSALLLAVTLSACQNVPAPLPGPTAAQPTTGPAPMATTPPVTITVTPANVVSSMTLLHTVQPGDNLFRIAQEYGVSVSKLAEINGITDPELIVVGQRLTIPLGTLPDPPTATATATPVPPTPTATPQPSGADEPTGPAGPPPTPSETPVPPTTVNGIAIDQFVIMPPAVQDNMRKIYAAGQALGRDPHAFSKLGDSTIENPHFLMRFDSGPYNLANYAYLQAVIDFYHGSFGRDSLAVRRGLHSWTALNPTWADETQCQPNEGPLACEIRVHNPSLIFVRLGSNDVGVPDTFRQSLRAIIDYCVQNGVIPIIGTKADRHEGEGNINNDIMRELAAKNNVPLWDFDLVAGTLPNRGIDPEDGTHMTFFYAHDYSLPEAFTRGHAVHNLTALIMLDRVWAALGLKSGN